MRRRIRTGDVIIFHAHWRRRGRNLYNPNERTRRGSDSNEGKFGNSFLVGAGGRGPLSLCP